jgi:hypothetical protein
MLPALESLLWLYILYIVSGVVSAPTGVGVSSAIWFPNVSRVASLHALVGVLALSVLLFLLVLVVVALISPAVYASSATVSGIPAVATARCG